MRRRSFGDVGRSAAAVRIPVDELRDDRLTAPHAVLLHEDRQQRPPLIEIRELLAEPEEALAGRGDDAQADPVDRRGVLPFAGDPEAQVPRRERGERQTEGDALAPRPELPENDRPPGFDMDRLDLRPIVLRAHAIVDRVRTLRRTERGDLGLADLRRDEVAVAGRLPENAAGAALMPHAQDVAAAFQDERADGIALVRAVRSRARGAHGRRRNERGGPGRDDETPPLHLRDRDVLRAIRHRSNRRILSL